MTDNPLLESTTHSDEQKSKSPTKSSKQTKQNGIIKDIDNEFKQSNSPDDDDDYSKRRSKFKSFRSNTSRSSSFESDDKSNKRVRKSHSRSNSRSRSGSRSRKSRKDRKKRNAVDASGRHNHTKKLSPVRYTEPRLGKSFGSFDKIRSRSRDYGRSRRRSRSPINKSDKIELEKSIKASQGDDTTKAAFAKIFSTNIVNVLQKSPDKKEKSDQNSLDNGSKVSVRELRLKDAKSNQLFEIEALKSAIESQEGKEHIDHDRIAKLQNLLKLEEKDHEKTDSELQSIQGERYDEDQELPAPRRKPKFFMQMQKDMRLKAREEYLKNKDKGEEFVDENIPKIVTKGEEDVGGKKSILKSSSYATSTAATKTSEIRDATLTNTLSNKYLSKNATKDSSPINEISVQYNNEKSENSEKSIDDDIKFKMASDSIKPPSKMKTIKRSISPRDRSKLAGNYKTERRESPRRRVGGFDRWNKKSYSPRRSRRSMERQKSPLRTRSLKRQKSRSSSKDRKRHYTDGVGDLRDNLSRSRRDLNGEVKKYEKSGFIRLDDKPKKNDDRRGRSNDKYKEEKKMKFTVNNSERRYKEEKYSRKESSYSPSPRKQRHSHSPKKYDKRSSKRERSYSSDYEKTYKKDKYSRDKPSPRQKIKRESSYDKKDKKYKSKYDSPDKREDGKKKRQIDIKYEGKMKKNGKHRSPSYDKEYLKELEMKRENERIVEMEMEMKRKAREAEILMEQKMHEREVKKRQMEKEATRLREKELLKERQILEKKLKADKLKKEQRRANKKKLANPKISKEQFKSLKKALEYTSDSSTSDSDTSSSSASSDSSIDKVTKLMATKTFNSKRNHKLKPSKTRSSSSESVASSDSETLALKPMKQKLVKKFQQRAKVPSGKPASKRRRHSSSSSDGRRSISRTPPPLPRTTQKRQDYSPPPPKPLPSSRKSRYEYR